MLRGRVGVGHAVRMVEGLDVGELWAAAGVVSGFQIGAFTWRINRELEMAHRGERVWVPVADWLNVAALVVTLLGVYAAGALGLLPVQDSALMFGWSVLLLACWPFAMLGHYDLLGRNPRTTNRPPITGQEAGVVVGAGVLSLMFWVVAAL